MDYAAFLAAKFNMQKYAFFSMSQFFLPSYFFCLFLLGSIRSQNQEVTNLQLAVCLRKIFSALS